MRVLICGGRDFADYRFFKDYMSGWLWKTELTSPPQIISGMVPGVDTMAVK